MFTEFTDGENEIEADIYEKFALPYGQSEESDEMWRSLAALKPNTFTAKCGAFTVAVSYDKEPFVAGGETRSLTLKFINNVKAYGNQPFFVNAEVLLPDGVACDKPAFKVYLPHWTPLTANCQADDITIHVTMPETGGAVTTLYLRLKAEGRYAVHTIPVVFLAKV